MRIADFLRTCMAYKSEPYVSDFVDLLPVEERDQ